MKTFTKRTKGTMIAILLRFFFFICGAFALFGNTSTTAFAHEQSEVHEHDNQERRLESYTGYGCNNGIDLQVNLSEQIENEMPEFIGNSAFSGITSLTQILIPASVTNIGLNAFENCTNLTNVTLPNSLL